MPGKNLVVIGGGAAGFFCAVNAARICPSLKVILLEKSSKLLSKVRISGGGRCNVTHHCFDIAELVRRYPRGQHFLKKTFHHFRPADTVNWFAERGVPLKTEPDGRMFPVTDSSETIIECLLKEANRYGVEVLLNREVKKLQPGERWTLDLASGETLEADYVCVACGGFPKQAQFNWLAETGHTIEPPVPSLFTFNIPGHPLTSLMGVVADPATVKISGTRLQETGPVLITHWGLSGPAVLRLSAWGARELASRAYAFSIVVNWLGTVSEPELRQQWPAYRQSLASKPLSGKNPFALPARLWAYLLQEAGITPAMRWGELPARNQNQLVQLLTAQPFTVKGKTTFKEEFVTCGGVSLREVDAHTMESRKWPRLYFAGEILDVDGITGGFNFQHAWTSGWIAAGAICARATAE